MPIDNHPVARAGSVHRSFIVLLVTVALSACTTSRTHPQTAVSGYDVSRLDQTQSACTDFNQFASGGWLAEHPIPPDADEWGTIAELIETNGRQIRELIEAAAARPANGSPAQRRVGDFYAACMDETAIEQDGIRPLADELRRIDAIDDTKSLFEAIASLHFLGADAVFDAGSTQDSIDARSVILELAQGGLGLPEPGYYFQADERSQNIRSAYLRHIARLFELAGESASLAAQHAATAVAIETRLAAVSMNRTQQRDPLLTTHRITIDELRAITPSIPWSAYFRAAGIAEPIVVNIAQPDFFRALDAEVSGIPLNDWKQYLRWQLLHRAAPDLSAPFASAHFDFYSVTLSGTAVQQPRWKRCVRATDRALTEAVGQLYVDAYFSDADRREAGEMVDRIVSALRSRIDSAGWLREATRREALRKIDLVVRKVGYPDTVAAGPQLHVDRRSHLRNTFQAARYRLSAELARIGKPLDRTHWSMSPQVPNARYGAATNEIIIPAAVLQPPLWDRAADSAFNYGAIGALIGHELTHAFDDRGARFDADGNLRDWWLREDVEEFGRRADCIAQQFDTYVIEDVHLNGKLVRGESIADLGGLTAALEAYVAATRGQPREVIGGFTPEQRVFLGWARMWTANLRPEYARKMALTNYHPVGRYRVNGTVSNMPEFATAFGCKTGDAMVRPPDVRCTVW